MGSKILIFSSTKKGCDLLTRQLRQDGINALAIHGDKTQQERDWVLREFKTSKAQVMVATDVAARGLDVKDIKFVINYDFPSCCEDYVHRIGRTGRAGALGTAYTFFTTTNCRQAKELIRILQENNQKIPEALRDMIELSRHSKSSGSNGIYLLLSYSCTLFNYFFSSKSMGKHERRWIYRSKFTTCWISSS